MADFAQKLQISRGVTAIIGGGGKTTLMYRLAEELQQQGSVIVTTSTHIWRPVHLPVVQRVGRVVGLVCVGAPCTNGKLAAPSQSFEELAALADYVLVEADGSAGRPLKAHAAHEPVIPANAGQVIAVVGASGLDQPIAQAVHRPAIFTQLSGAEETASPEAVALVLQREALHGRVLINQADTPERIRLAKALAAQIPEPVVIAALQKGEIIC